MRQSTAAIAAALLGAATLCLLAAPAPTSGDPTTTVELTRLPRLSNSTAPSHIALLDGGIVIMDGYSDRLMFLNPDGSPARDCGAIGSKPGQFYHPGGISTDNGEIAVLDNLNDRVQILSADCGVVAELPLDPAASTSRSLALLANGSVAINEPASQWLAAITHTRSGPAHIGARVSAPALYPNHPNLRQFDPAANFAWLATGPAGALYAAYDIAPVVKKFAPDGRLIFTTRLTGRGPRRLEDLFLNHAQGDQGMLKSSLGGIEADFVLKSLFVDRGSGDIYVLGGLDNLYRLSPDGRQLGTVHLALKNTAIGPPGLIQAVVSGNAVYAVAVFAPGVYVGMLPQQWAHSSGQRRTAARQAKPERR